MKAGFVAMVGLPNAGKSTIVNALIGEKVGIVSKKPQTTRKRVIGVYNDEDAQICFIDAPGRVQADSGLNHFLQKELDGVVADSDVCVAVLNLDAQKSSDLIEIVELVKKSGRPWLALINKTDLDVKMSDGMREAKLRQHLLAEGVPVLSCSAIKQTDELCHRLLPLLKEMLSEAPARLYEEDIYTTQPVRELVAEVVREKCFEYLHQEVPYGLAVKVLKFDESKSVPRVYVEIIVSKENFVSMVVGKGGSMIKRIGASARIDCEKQLGHKIYLETHVKLKKDWVKNPDMMRELGYVITD